MTCKEILAITHHVLLEESPNFLPKRLICIQDLEVEL